MESQHLHSISTGVVSQQGNDEVNCERVEEIGKSIQQSFDNLPLSQCKVPRSELMKNLSLLQAHPKKIERDDDRPLHCPQQVVGSNELIRFCR